MEIKLFTKIEKAYYAQFQRKNETILDTITRVDNKIIDDNFKWVCDRDILTSDVIFNDRKSSTKVREWKNRQEFAN
jgi:hypothetical protein